MSHPSPSRSQAGTSTVVSLVVVLLGAAVAMFLGLLVATGLWQSRIWPIVQARVDQAVSSVKGEEAAPDDSSVVALPEEPSLDDADAVLLAQLETQKRFLEEQEKELVSLRTQIEELVTQLETVRSEEVTRQAKLFAAMKPDEAAAVLAAVDDPTLVAILRAMNARAASQVAARIHPRRLAKLSMEGIAASEVAALLPTGEGR